MNGYPPFVLEIVKWAGTLSVDSIELSAPSDTHSILLTLSRHGSKLLVHLLPGIEKQNTSISADNQGVPPVRYVTVWADLWHTKQPIITSRLAALLGISERIPARMTQVRRVDRPTTLAFLQENHLQDAVLSKYKYGLFLPKKYYRILENPSKTDELLVAVATFARPRHFVRGDFPYHSFELVRFANLLNTTVVGGLDKLLSHFIKQHQPNDLMTYADLDWSVGDSYRKLGFEAINDIRPQQFRVDPVTMTRYLPHRLPDGMTQQNADDRGFLTVYNAGSRKFVKVLTPTT